MIPLLLCPSEICKNTGCHIDKYGSQLWHVVQHKGVRVKGRIHCKQLLFCEGSKILHVLLHGEYVEHFGLSTKLNAVLQQHWQCGKQGAGVDINFFS